jgi:hypothetical protein
MPLVNIGGSELLVLGLIVAGCVALPTLVVVFAVRELRKRRNHPTDHDPG